MCPAAISSRVWNATLSTSSGLEGERTLVHAGEHPAEAADALVFVVEVEPRLEGRVADAELLGRLAHRARLVRLPGRDDPARREVEEARVDVLDRGAALDEHPSLPVEDEDERRPVGQVLAANEVARKLRDGTVLVVDHGDDLFTGEGGHRGLRAVVRTGTRSREGSPRATSRSVSPGLRSSVSDDWGAGETRRTPGTVAGSPSPEARRPGGTRFPLRD